MKENLISALHNVGYSYTLNGEETFVPLTAEALRTGRFEHRENGVVSRWSSEDFGLGSAVRLEIDLKEACRLDSFKPFCAEGAFGGFSAVVAADMNQNFVDLSDGAAFDSATVHIFRGGEGLVARSVYPLDFHERWYVEQKGEVTSFSLVIDPPETYSAASFSSPRVYLGLGRAADCLREFFSLLPKIWDGVGPLVGYNTWDYYFSGVSEEDVLENLQFIEKDPVLKGAIRCFTVDDGWQCAWGDWYANYRFPHGLKALADRIKAAGLIPGIWTAPLYVQPGSAYSLRGMTGFFRNEYGDPERADGGKFMLDPTHPETVRMVRELYTRLYDAGFRLFKIDFLSFVSRMTRFYDPAATQYGALRDLMKLIRECVKDSIILGCSLPAEACAPEASCGRTGFDIHIKWNHVLLAMERLQLCWGQHRRIWANDVDFLVVRGPETDNDPCRSTLDPKLHSPLRRRWRMGEDFTLREARSWASLVLLSGGNLNLSDRLSMLNEKGLDIIHRAIEARREESAVPLDQFEGPYPCVWQQGDRFIVINFGEEEREFSVPSSEALRDLWTDRVISSENSRVTITLRPHESMVLCKP